MGMKNIEDIEYCCDFCGSTKKLSEIYEENGEKDTYFDRGIYTAEIKEIGVNKHNSRVASYVNGVKMTNMAYRATEKRVEKIVICKECLDKLDGLKTKLPKDQHSVKHNSTKKESEDSIKLRQFSVSILNAVENLLDRKDITIPNDDREGDPDEARLYGRDCYELDEVIVRVLDNLVTTIKENPNKVIDISNL